MGIHNLVVVLNPKPCPTVVYSKPKTVNYQGIHKRIVMRQDDGDEVGAMRICPLHASLPVEFYQRVFDEAPAGTRKLVVATNIAETSITVPGIK